MTLVDIWGGYRFPNAMIFTRFEGNAALRTRCSVNSGPGISHLIYNMRVLLLPS